MAWGAGSDTVIDDWIQKILSNNSSFTSLTILSFRKPSQRQFVKLFNALRNNTVIQELYCSGKILELEAIQALSNSLIINTSLKQLSIGYTNFGTDTRSFDLYCRGLSQFKGNLNVDLSGFSLSSLNTESLLYLFKHQTGIIKINLSVNQLDQNAFEVIASAICENRHMELPISLEISDNPITDMKLFSEYLSSPNLKVSELNSYDNPMAPEDVHSIIINSKRNTWFKTLRLSFPEKEKDTLKPNTKENYIENSVQFIPELDSASESHLETLLLYGMHLDFFQLGTLVGCHCSLKSLSLRRTRLSDDEFRYLASCLILNSPNLEHLDVGSNFLTDRSLWTCLELTNIRHIIFIENYITLSSIEEATTLHKGWNQLIHMDLNCNRIGIDAISNFLALLSLNIDGSFLVPLLKNLEIAGNDKTGQDSWTPLVEEFCSIRPSISVTWK